jgi:hypothetical protein
VGDLSSRGNLETIIAIVLECELGEVVNKRKVGVLEAGDNSYTISSEDLHFALLVWKFLC